MVEYLPAWSAARGRYLSGVVAKEVFRGKSFPLSSRAELQLETPGCWVAFIDRAKDLLRQQWLTYPFKVKRVV